MDTCPRCETKIRQRPVTEQFCPSCGHRWPRPLPLPIALEVQRAEGDEPIGIFDRTRLREMIYVGELSGRERVRVPGTLGWRPITEQDAFSDLFTMLNISTQPSNSRIRGWKAPQGATRPEQTYPPLPELDVPFNRDVADDNPLTTPILIGLSLAGLGALGVFIWSLT